ncbi:MAG: alpha-ribazole phosphatase [Planctomycetota bacterium]|nr:MAG: alpha-ribazole phosphatase [Planctomycetota bacterium]
MSAATRVRLVRHGEVAAAHHGKFYGGADVPLSEEGARLSVELAERLALDRPDLVLSSPLARARAVADPLAARCELSVRVEPDLRELDRGSWTHLSTAEVEARSPGAVAAYCADPEAGAAPGGEPESALCARVWPVFDTLAAEFPGASVVAVAHGHVIRSVLRRLKGWSAPRSLELFVPYHAVVELLLRPDGSGEVVHLPAGELPEALARANPSPPDR